MIKRMDETRIKRAFEYFDKEKKGYITRDDLKDTLMLDSNQVLDQIVSDVDKNKVSFLILQTMVFSWITELKILCFRMERLI